MLEVAEREVMESSVACVYARMGTRKVWPSDVNASESGSVQTARDTVLGLQHS